MSGEKKKLSRDEYLTALALFTMAQSYAAKSRAFEKEMAVLLGYGSDDPYAGCVSDAVYDEAGSFDAGLKSEGFDIPDIASATEGK